MKPLEQLEAESLKIRREGAWLAVRTMVFCVVSLLIVEGTHGFFRGVYTGVAIVTFGTTILILSVDAWIWFCVWQIKRWHRDNH